MTNNINKPHIKLRNGDVLFEGDYVKRRDGEVVGPLEYRNDLPDYFVADGWHYNSIGVSGHKGRGNGGLYLDLIARADPPEAETQDEPKLLRDVTKPDEFHQHEALHIAHVMIVTWNDYVLQTEYVEGNEGLRTVCYEALEAMTKAYQAIGREDME